MDSNNLAIHSNTCPLVIDLDGTLTPSDSLWEGLLHMLATTPWRIFLIPLWLSRGRLYTKMRLASYSVEASKFLPLRVSVLAALKAARERGCSVYLATAAPLSVAEKIAERLQAENLALDGIFASTPEVNLKGAAKAQALAAAFGTRGFDYIGDSSADLPVWGFAREAFVVGNKARLSRRLASSGIAHRLLDTECASWKTYLKAIRLHQWLKNILLFIPVFLAHAFTVNAVERVFLGICCFCCCASSVYLLNDLLDLASDRQHARKRFRPLAAGLIPLWQGLCLAFCLLFAAIVICLFLPAGFAHVLAFYYALTLAYSFMIKRLLMLDVVVLSLLYLLRVVAGAVAIGVAISHWLLAFCVFIFLALALLKRIGEFQHNVPSSLLRAPGRAYFREDVPILGIMSACSAFSASVILALYIDSQQAFQLYDNPEYLWAFLPLLIYFYGRLFFIFYRGGDSLDDPVAYVLRDRCSLLCTISSM